MPSHVLICIISASLSIVHSFFPMRVSSFCCTYSFFPMNESNYVKIVNEQWDINMSQTSRPSRNQKNKKQRRRKNNDICPSMITKWNNFYRRKYIVDKKKRPPLKHMTAKTMFFVSCWNADKERADELQEWASRGTDFAKFKWKQSWRGGEDKSFCDKEWTEF